ncbi:lipopolysaccharide biosynthesis protein [Hahella sp. SMD15-11]|uniref:Lipopolysaccharide biosynthesis protein n=1 Tax=Thermohahella caldifontis TaxID=3142973 RepID=A0AB39V003_9GAMM
MFGWLLLRAAVQAVLVLLLARWLGPENYGIFVSILAIASFFTPLAGLGLAALILRDGAKSIHLLSDYLQKANRLWAIASIVASAAALGTILLVFPRVSGFWATAIFVSAEVAAVSLIEIISRSKQARHQLNGFGAIITGLPVVRCSILLILMAVSKPATDDWLVAYASVTWLYVMLLWWLIARKYDDEDDKKFDSSGSATYGKIVQDGVPFVMGALAYRLQAEFNKPVIAHTGFAAAGALNVAHRVVDMASLPLAALQEALWPRVFSSASPKEQLVRTGSMLVMFALLLGGVISFSAPLLQLLLGEEYGQAVSVLSMLAFLPTVQVLRNLAGASLIADGRRRSLYMMYLTAAISGILLTVFLVPRHGLKGAVAAMYGSEGFTAVTALCAVIINYPKMNNE